MQLKNFFLKLFGKDPVVQAIRSDEREIRSTNSDWLKEATKANALKLTRINELETEYEQLQLAQERLQRDAQAANAHNDYELLQKLQEDFVKNINKIGVVSGELDSVRDEYQQSLEEIEGTSDEVNDKLRDLRGDISTHYQAIAHDKQDKLQQTLLSSTHTVQHNVSSSRFLLQAQRDIRNRTLGPRKVYSRPLKSLQDSGFVMNEHTVALLGQDTFKQLQSQILPKPETEQPVKQEAVKPAGEEKVSQQDSTQLA